MQNFINRLCPLIDPTLKNINGRTRARFRKNVKIKKIVLVSTCGWWELENFDTVKRIVKELASDGSVEFGGSVLRPHAYLMEKHPAEKELIMATLKEAGQQLIAEGKISKDKFEVISKPLISFEDCLKE
jgi:hypothetical protein